MLDRERHIAHGRPDLVFKLPEYSRPIWIIVDHLNGSEGCWFRHSSIVNAMDGTKSISSRVVGDSSLTWLWKSRPLSAQDQQTLPTSHY